MRYYDSKNWIKIIFAFSKTDTFKVMIIPIILFSIFCSIVGYIELNYFEENAIKNLSKISIIHTTLGFVLSLLLVFRTNSAYDRWWEGRKLWGSLVNNSRNLAVFFNSIFSDIEDRKVIKNTLSLFPYILKEHLSKISTSHSLDEEYNEIYNKLATDHKPLELINNFYIFLTEKKQQNKISKEDLIFISTQLNGYMDICGACERIKNTPIPFSYISFIKKFISLYIISFPIANVFTIGYSVVPISVFLFYVLFSLEIIAEEIEDPFNDDENDIPMDLISNNINKSVHLIFRE